MAHAAAPPEASHGRELFDRRYNPVEEAPSPVARAVDTTTDSAPFGMPTDAGQHPPRLVLRCFPGTDRGFVADVHGLIAKSWQSATDPDDLLEIVAEELARKYPSATIQPRDPLAELGAEQWDTWYVYRDGRAA